MKLFEFDIAWDQPVSEQFDQDDIKVIGKQRVESDAVRVVAPDYDSAWQALEHSFKRCELLVRQHRELPVHVFVERRVQLPARVPATRVIGNVRLNDLGRLMDNRRSLTTS